MIIRQCTNDEWFSKQNCYCFIINDNRWLYFQKRAEYFSLRRKLSRIILETKG